MSYFIRTRIFIPIHLSLEMTNCHFIRSENLLYIFEKRMIFFMCHFLIYKYINFSVTFSSLLCSVCIADNRWLEARSC